MTPLGGDVPPRNDAIVTWVEEISQAHSTEFESQRQGDLVQIAWMPETDKWG